MRISRNFSNANSLLILCLLVSATCSCSAILARASKRRVTEVPEEHPPARGLRIIKVVPGSMADHAGLQPMDLIFRYGDFEVVDDASYFAAREAYEKNRAPEVPILVWRPGKAALRFTVGAGWLGIFSNEYSPVAYDFSGLMKQVDIQRSIPEYLLDREFKNSYIATEKLIEQAKAIIDKAEQEGTLTPNQILVARIQMILDDAPPQELKRQSDLLAQLVATQPPSYLHMLGQDHFFEDKHYRPAIECFKRHLEAHPDDVSIRLNMGIAYYSVGMFTEAEAAADYVFDHQLGLGEHGQVVAWQIKALGTLNRGDYAKTISFAEKAFEIEPRDFLISMAMLAAAKTGDLQEVEKASQMFQQALPQDYAKKKLHVAAVEALALVKSNQRPKARALASEWKDTDRVEGRLKAYWKLYPGGSDVWTNWNQLTKD
jgi:tetratricopeptide (TPR) repeat protein